VDKTGRAVAATLFDFKTEPVQNISAQTQQHQPQLWLYRHALAGLTGLDETHIMVYLVFTQTQVLVPLTFSR
jgi:hypothetical protein